MAKQLLLAVICLLCWNQGYAQRAIGVDWELPDEQQIAREQLQYFSELGIGYLQINERPSEEVWNVISDLDFTVFAQLPVQFATVQTFSKADSSFKEKINANLQYYASRQSVKAIGLFAYGQINERIFRKALTEFMQQLPGGISKPIYYQTAKAKTVSIDSLFAFKMLRVSQDYTSMNSAVKAYYYAAESKFDWKLAPVKEFLNQTPKSSEIPVFFNSEWLLTILNNYPEFEITLQTFATVQNPVFALPEEERAIDSENNALIAALLLVWILLSITYYISPVFRKSLVRYFTGHPYYVRDVMDRYVRTMLPGTSILAQHVLLGGIVGYCVGNSLFSSLGIEAFYSHYPIFSIFGEDNFAFFWGGFIAILVAQIICVVWLHLANPKLNHFSQIFNLYPWLLQINVIPATLIVGLFTSKGSIILLFILGVIFMLSFAAAFIITALDGITYISTNQKYWFLPATAGLYLLVIAGLVTWALFSTQFINVIKLAAALP